MSDERTQTDEGLPVVGEEALRSFSAETGSRLNTCEEYIQE